MPLNIQDICFYISIYLFRKWEKQYQMTTSIKNRVDFNIENVLMHKYLSLISELVDLALFDWLYNPVIHLITIATTKGLIHKLMQTRRSVFNQNRRTGQTLRNRWPVHRQLEEKNTFKYDEADLIYKVIKYNKWISKHKIISNV